MTTMTWFRRPIRRAGLHAAAAFVLAVAASAAPGDLATKFRVNDDDPSKDLPTQEEANQHPLQFGYLVQDLVARGEGALQKKEWERGAKYYRALAALVPDRAIAHRKICSAEMELGRIDQAAASCGQVLSRAGARVWDHFRYLELMLEKTSLTPADVTDMESSITHLRAHAAANLVPEKQAPAEQPTPASSASSAARTKERIKEDFLRRREQRGLDEAEKKASEEAKVPPNLPLEIELVACRLAVRMRDERELGACVDGLTRLGADPKLVLSFDWARTLVRKDSQKAQELLARAKALGLPAPALAAMGEEQRRTFASKGIFGWLRGPGFIVALVALASAVAAGAFFLARKLKRENVSAAQDALPQ